MARVMQRDYLDDFFRGTFAPFLRASDRPIAMACLRLLTVLPEPPDLSVPFLRLCMARLTDAPAFLEYFAMSIIMELDCLRASAERMH